MQKAGASMGHGDELLQKAQQGDQAAIEALFRREWRPVYRLIYRSLPDPAEAQDLAQEVFIRALTSLDRFQPTTTPFAGYLAVIARNLLRDRWRKQSPPTASDTQAAHLVSTAAGPEQVALMADEQTRIAALLAPLPADYRRVIELRVLEGRPTNEVAALMGRSPGAIRILQHRAITTLRQQMHEGSGR
jgi:RNA polymerase sigma-70 factor (ECF subfamily)